jgi:nucleoside phosphorylase
VHETPVLLVPHGAEEDAVRRAAPNATVVGIRAGASAAQLPEELPAGPIVVMGLCGALRGIRTGGIVIYHDIVDELGRYTFDGEQVTELHARIPEATLVHACTIDHVVTRATERVALAAAYNADVADMETTHLARALAARGRPSLVIRVASDDPSFDLPPIEDAFGADGKLRPLHLARAFVMRPAAAVRFVRDVQRALQVLAQTAARL